MDADIYDYIVIGGGSAGAVVANRLSTDPAIRVLLLEAGPPQGSPLLKIPVGFYKCLGNSAFDWCYSSEPDPTSAGKRIHYNAGKMLGGSSALNGMIFIRGQRDDFDGWREAGCAGWGFDDVLPYFRKLESFIGPARPSQGVGGPQYVSHPRHIHPLTYDWMDACAAMGVPRLADYGGGDQSGAFIALTSTKRARRWSTAHGYLDPIRKRGNLTILCHANVDRVLHDKGVAQGVRYILDGRAVEAKARREVIISAGAMNSPSILMRSGIGPGEALKAAGIEVRHELPGVGRNLHDHPALMISRCVDVPTLNTQTGRLTLAAAMIRYLTTRRGILAAHVVHAMAMLKSSPDLAAPDILFSFVPMAMDRTTSIPGLLKVPGVSIAINAVRPRSRGQVTLRDADPDSAPVIDFRLFGDDRDVRTMAAGYRLAQKMFEQRPLAPHVTGLNDPAVDFSDEADLEAFIRERSDGSWHPVGTCRMGVDADAVVDPALRVRGMTGLRVMDASVMPRITSGNTNAPTIMIAEKGADLILHGR